MTGTFYAIHPTYSILHLHCTCWGSLVQKPIKEHTEVVRRSQEASRSIQNGQKAAESVRKYLESSRTFRKLTRLIQFLKNVEKEQLAGFTQLLDVVARSTGQLEGFTGGCSL